MEPLLDIILIKFFIGFPILSYPIRAHTPTGIWYTKAYARSSQSNLLSRYIQIIILYGSNTLPSKSWVFKSRFSFKVRQQGQQQFYLQYKVCWILYKMVGASSFSQPCLCIRPPLQSPPKILFSISFNFHPGFTSLQSPLILSSSIPQQFLPPYFSVQSSQ